MRNILVLFVPHVIILRAEQPCCRVVVLYSYIGMGVMLMKHFDFKDLMSFGMFILALLTFIVLICR